MSWPSTTMVCQLERVPARGNLVHVVAELRVLALAEPVDVDDRAQVVELVMDRDIGGFPDRSFRHLAVAKQHVGAVRRNRCGGR